MSFNALVRRIRRLSVLVLCLCMLSALVTISVDNIKHSRTQTVSLSDVLYISSTAGLGSRGNEVMYIQKKLQQHGFYTGDITGTFDEDTEKSLRLFQQHEGLEDDGLCGPETMAAIELGTGGISGGYSEAEIYMIARMISAEARGEPYEGQVAVGAVILNRVEHPSFPCTISDVCYQNGAFSPVSNGQFYNTPTDSCVQAAYDAVNGCDPTGGALYFYNPDTTTCKWILSREVIATIGNHRFCI